MKKVLRRLAIFALILSGLYLVPVNLALNLPVTQKFLNELQPDRFAVGWSRAWSWYPLRMEVWGLAADGQSATEQWQLDAKAAAASISLLPLFKGKVRVHDLDLWDIQLRLRSRPTSEKDSAELAKYFPPIRNRDPEDRAEPPSKEDSGSLRLAIDDFHMAGTHEFWVDSVRGAMSGELRCSFSIDTGTGRVALADGEVDLALTSLQIGADRGVTGDAWVRGKVDVPPFVISDVTADQVRHSAKIDAEIDLPIQDLHFLESLAGGAPGVDLTGKGRLRGRWIQTGGEERSGTDLVAEASELRLGLARANFSGKGFVELKVDESDFNKADLRVHFGEVEAFLKSDHGEQTPPLFVGRDMDANLHLSRPDGPQGRTEMQLELSAPTMQAPDLSLYSALMPEKWGARLLGGEGDVSGHILLGHQGMDMELDLSSGGADVRFRGSRVATDLSLVLRAQAKADTGAHLDLAGTELRLADVRVAGAGAGKVTPWQGGLEIHEGHVTVLVPDERADVDPFAYLIETLEKHGFGRLLQNADGRLGATLKVSQLDWIAGLLGRPLGLTLAGSGEIDAGLVLENGRLTQGTKLQIPRRLLQLGLLEHRIDGQGLAALSVERSHGEPALRLDAEFADARVERLAGERPAADKMHLKTEVLVPKSVSKDGRGAVIRLEIPSARIPDSGFRYLQCLFSARHAGEVSLRGSESGRRSEAGARESEG